MFHECYLRKGADYIRSVDFKDSEIKRAVEEAGTTIFRKKQQLKEIVEKQFRVGETYRVLICLIPDGCLPQSPTDC